MATQTYMTAKLNLADGTIVYPQISLDNIVRSISDPTLVTVAELSGGKVPIAQLPTTLTVTDSNNAVPTAGAVYGALNTKQATLVEGDNIIHIINGSTIMADITNLDVAGIDQTATNGVHLVLDGNTVSAAADLATNTDAGVIAGATNGVGVVDGVLVIDEATLVPATVGEVLAGATGSKIVDADGLTGALSLGQAVDVSCAPYNSSGSITYTDPTVGFISGFTCSMVNGTKIGFYDSTTHKFPKFAAGLKYLMIADVSGSGSITPNGGSAVALSSTAQRISMVVTADNTGYFSASASATAVVSNWRQYEVTALTDEAIQYLASAVTNANPDNLFRSEDFFNISGRYLVKSDMVNPWTYLITMTTNSPAMTVGSGLAYKLSLTDGGSHEITVDTFPTNAYGADAHIQLLLANDSTAVFKAPLNLIDPLTPNAAHNITIKFRAGQANVYVDDTDVGYTVTVNSGSTSGSLYYGMVSVDDKYIVFSALTDGTPVDAGTVASVGSEKNIVGNGVESTTITGSITNTSKVTFINMALDDVTLIANAELVLDSVICTPDSITGTDAVIITTGTKVDLTGNTNTTPISTDYGVVLQAGATVVSASGSTVAFDPRTYGSISKEGELAPANYVYGYAQGTTQATSNYVPIVLENNVISKVSALDRNKMSCHERRIVVMNDCSTRHINYYLNPSDLTKKLDGTASVLDGADGDVMTEVMPYYRLRIQLAPQNDTETRECVLMSRYPFAYTDSSNVEHVAEYFKPFKISPTGDEVRPQYIGYYQASTEIVGVAGKVTEVAALGATSIKVQLTTSDSQDVNYLQGTGKLVIGGNTVNYTARSYSGGVFTFTCAALPAAVAVDDAVTVVGRTKLRSVSSTVEKYVYPTVSLKLGPTGSEASTVDSFLCRAEHNGATICNELHYEMLFDLFVCDKLTVNTQSVAYGLAGLSSTSWGTIYPRACGYTNQVENFYGGSTLADSRDEDIINFWGSFTITSGGVAYTTDAGGCTWHEDATTGKRIVDVYRWRNGTSPNFTYVYTKGSDGFPTTSTKCYTDTACTEGEAAITAVGTPTAQASRWTSCKYFVENPWGSIWQNLAGFGPFVSGTTLGYFITTSMNRYKEVLKTTTGAGTTVPASGGNAAIEWVGHSWPQTSNWVTTWNMDTFLPLTVGTNVMQDYFYTNVSTAGNLRAGVRGGRADRGSAGGLGYVSVDAGVGSASAFFGARLAA